jgi:PPOX class probable F420-dependent enzyme
MTDGDLEALLAEERVVTCATIGPNGRPHLMPLWYVADGTTITSWTFAKSQKVKNLERVPQATLQVEAGEKYQDLRGVMLECDVELVRASDAVMAIGLALSARYASSGGPAGPSADREAAVAAQAPKRVGLRFHPTRIVSWDHRKLGGGY